MLDLFSCSIKYQQTNLHQNSLGPADDALRVPSGIPKAMLLLAGSKAFVEEVLQEGIELRVTAVALQRDLLLHS